MSDGSVAPTLFDGHPADRAKSARQPARSGPTRRRLIGTLGVLGTVGIAGCLGGDGDDDGDGSSDGSGDGGDGNPAADLTLAGDTGEAFRDWVIPDNPIHEPEGAQLVCRYEDLVAADEAGYAPLVNHRNNTADALGVEAAAVSGELLVGAPEDWPLSEIGIIFGEFDKSTVVDFFEGPGDRTISGEYGEYTIFENVAAVGSNAVLETTRYRDYIDASVGEHQRIEEAEAAFGTLFDVLPEGVITQVFRRHRHDDVAASARTSTEYTDDQPTRAIETVVFESASDTSTDRAVELVSALNNFDGAVTEESSGHVAMIEYDLA